MTPTDPSHPSHPSPPLCRHLPTVGRTAGTCLLEHLQTLATAAKTLWGSHAQLMDSNGLYRAVVASLAGLIGRQLDLERVILAVVTALIRAHTRPPTPPPPRNGYGYGYDGYGGCEADYLDGWADDA